MNYLKNGGIFLRILITSIIILILAFVIKVDIQEGTLPMTSFYAAPAPCVEKDEYTYVNVTVMEGDTIYSLFSATPSPTKMTFPERLAKFYELNPHLQLQTLVQGESVLIPIHVNTEEICPK